MRKYSRTQHDLRHLAANVHPRLGLGRVSEDIGVHSREDNVEGNAARQLEAEECPACFLAIGDGGGGCAR